MIGTAFWCSQSAEYMGDICRKSKPAPRFSADALNAGAPAALVIYNIHVA